MATKTVLATLRVGFADTLAQFEAAILCMLAVYWSFSRWEAIRAKFSRENLGPTMLGVIILFSLFLGTMFTIEWGTEFFGLAAMLACCIALGLCDTSISICVFLALLFLRPWEIIQNNDYFAVLPRLTMSLCLVNGMIDYTKRGRIKIEWNRTASFLMGFAVWLLLTTVKSGNPEEAMSFFFDVVFKDIFLFVLILNLVKTPQELDLIVWTIVITMCGVGVASVYQTWQYMDSPMLAALSGALTGAEGEEVRLLGFGAFENSNDIGAIMVMVLPFMIVPVLNSAANRWVRLGSLIAIVIDAGCIFMCKSRGAQLGVVASIGIYSFVKMKNRKHAVGMVVLALLASAGASQLSSRNEADLDESKRFRVIYLETGIVMGLKNPILGVGFNGYGDAFTRYQTGEVESTDHRTAHNSWVLAFGETGGVGLALFLAFFGSVGLLAWKIRKQKPEFLMALVGYGIAMSFLSHTYLIYPYLLCVLICVAYAQYGGKSDEALPAAGGTDVTPAPAV